jgi:cytoskeletal protein CcmA (bactofilin family)
MFRRKEESLFDNEFSAEEETVTVVQPAAANTPAAEPANASTASSTTNSSQPTNILQGAAAAPITRPNAPVPPAVQPNSFRPNTPVTSPVSQATNSISRQAEVKSMNPISSLSQNSQSSNKPVNRVLTVGNDILLKGEINSCDRLVIEGKLEATLNDVHTVELAECGSFKGSANVVEAQISGLFEGDLVVTGRLVIYASGKVRGNISYGEIEIERGGELSGQIKSDAASASSSLPKALRKEAA